MAKQKHVSRNTPAPTLRAATTPAEGPPPGRSPKFLAISIAATLNITAGVLGLLMPENFPALARQVVAVTLIGLGLGLEIWAIRMLIAAQRAQDALLAPRRR